MAVSHHSRCGTCPWSPLALPPGHRSRAHFSTQYKATSTRALRPPRARACCSRCLHPTTRTAERKAQLWHAEHMKRQFDSELLRSLVPEGEPAIDKLHFVLGMLTNLKIIQWSDVQPFIDVFEAWDK